MPGAGPCAALEHTACAYCGPSRWGGRRSPPPGQRWTKSAVPQQSSMTKGLSQVTRWQGGLGLEPQGPREGGARGPACGTSPVNSGGSGLTPTGEPLGTAGCGGGARNLSALARSAASAASPICMAGSRGDVACGCRLRLRDGGGGGTGGKPKSART